MGSLTPSTSPTSSSIITTATNTTTTTTTSTTSPFQLLEITIISAQDLAPVLKSMRTYAVVWVQPDQKMNTRVDHQGGHTNPTWNEKFVFRIGDDFLNSDSSAVMVEIYTVSWFRDNLVGNVKVLINNLIAPFSKTRNTFTTRFVALQVRRASGSPQGILNMGVSLIDSSMQSMPIYTELSGSAIHGYFSDQTDNNKLHKKEEDHKNQERVDAKIQLWRSRSEKSDLNFDNFFPPKGGSMCNGGSIINGSIVNGSELCSDVGPSASIVAATIAKGLYPSAEHKVVASTAEVEERGSSILEDLTVEEATTKGYRLKDAERWWTELPSTRVDQSSNKDRQVHSRRHSDAGLFSCFAYGFEFTIVCGTKNNTRNKNASCTSIDKPMIKRSSSHQNL